MHHVGVPSRRTAVSALVAAMIALATACWIVPDRITTGDVRVLIAAELSPGADAQQVEEFFRRHNIAFGYDRYRDIYHGIIRDVSQLPLVDKAIEIDINLSAERENRGAVVYASFTFL